MSISSTIEFIPADNRTRARAHDNELEENLKKTFAQIDVASEIYKYTLGVAIRIVDEHLPYAEQIEKAKLPSEKHERIMERQEAISVIVGNLLQLSSVVRV